MQSAPWSERSGRRLRENQAPSPDIPPLQPHAHPYTSPLLAWLVPIEPRCSLVPHTRQALQPNGYASSCCPTPVVPRRRARVAQLRVAPTLERELSLD